MREHPTTLNANKVELDFVEVDDEQLDSIAGGFGGYIDPNGTP